MHSLEYGGRDDRGPSIDDSRDCQANEGGIFRLTPLHTLITLNT
jgi:hypothetical protein